MTNNQGIVIGAVMSNLIALALIFLAGFLAYNHIPYWGWVVGAAVLCVTTLKRTDDER